MYAVSPASAALLTRLRTWDAVLAARACAYSHMRVWERDDWLATEPAVVREYAAIWRDADKVVYSSTLDAVSTARTRIERQFEPAAVRRLKETSTADLSIGGATI